MSNLIIRTASDTVKYLPLWSSLGTSYPAKIAVRTASNKIEYAGVSKTHSRDSCLRMRLPDGSVGYVRRAPNDTIKCDFSGSTFIDRSGHTWDKIGSPSLTTVGGYKCIKCFDGSGIKLQNTGNVVLPKASKFFYRYKFYTEKAPCGYSALVRFDGANVSYGRRLWIFWYGGKLGYQLRTNNLNVKECTMNAWHQMVITYNNGKWNAYLDGTNFVKDADTGNNGVAWSTFTLSGSGDYSNSYYRDLQVFIGGFPGQFGSYVNTGADTENTVYLDMRW